MCENGAELKKGKMLMTTTQGQRQEKTQLVARVEKYKLEEEMAVLSSSVWMAMLYCLRKKVNTG